MVILWFHEKNYFKAVKYVVSGHAHLTYPSVPENYIMEFNSNFALLG